MCIRDSALVDGATSNPALQGTFRTLLLLLVGKPLLIIFHQEDFFFLCDSFRLSQIRLKFDSGHVTYVDCSVIRGHSVIRGQY